ncbi:MAG: hypothetical protein Q9190_003273 [Brigantiaea leucoxantha]
MGSRGPVPETKDDELNILVTGFGPFGTNRINPSHLIASSLPSSFRTKSLSKVNIIVASPIPVIYESVRELVPKLLFPNESTDDRSVASVKNGSESRTSFSSLNTARLERRPRYDMVLHIGMAPGRKYFTLETCAHRDGYKAMDEDGDTLTDDTLFRDEFKAPEILTTGFNTDDLWKRWKSELPDEDVRPSRDAGRFLCEFIYFTSLVEFWRQNREIGRPVMFLHVPGRIEDVDITTGRKVAMGLIGAMVASWRRED